MSYIAILVLILEGTHTLHLLPAHWRTILFIQLLHLLLMVVVVLIWVIGWLLIEKAFIVVLSIHLLEFKEVIGVEELLLSLLLLVAFDA